ncbi:hypothetical protein OS12_00100 [Dickeya oryzae]
MQKAQEEIANLEVTGESGAGLVKVTINGAHNCRRVEIDPSLMEDDKEMLEDLIAAAFNDAARRIAEVQQEKNGLGFQRYSVAARLQDAVLMQTSPLLEALMEALRCLPGVGPKSAQRMAFHLLQRDRSGGDASGAGTDPRHVGDRPLCRLPDFYRAGRVQYLCEPAPSAERSDLCGGKSGGYPRY